MRGVYGKKGRRESVSCGGGSGGEREPWGEWEKRVRLGGRGRQKKIEGKEKKLGLGFRVCIIFTFFP